MSHNLYDPAKQAGSPVFGCDGTPNCCCPICGPGGATINIENNEKGILETALKPLTTPEYAELGSDHDNQRQGIYRTNSAGDND
jgi:hypothetical protein